tara:strand:+ start:472 stop:933 length:462 start_codon:yes stop_codon:yes gene_type:complete
MTNTPPLRILAVCLGNICRSPIAHGLLEHHSNNHEQEFIIDSAGTIGMHSGNQPDYRSMETMLKHGIDISHQRSRQFRHYDFEQFDIILAMDDSNYRDLQSVAIKKDELSKIKMMIDGTNVPDPYYGGDEGFEKVYQMLDEAIHKLISELASN